MTKFKFHRFLDYEDGKIACLETTGNMHIPVNVFIDNYEDVKDFDIHSCEIDVCGIADSFEIFQSEDDFFKADLKMAPEFVIPTGAFPLDPKDENFVQSSNLIFCGKVSALELKKDAAEDETNYNLWIETLDLEIDLYLRYDGVIERGNIVYADAWLCGDLEIT